MIHVPGTRYALTTLDNPYNPFTDFSRWYMFDVEKGYNSASLVGRIAHTSDQLSDEENNKEISRAIDEILKYAVTNNYKKVFDASLASA